MKAPHRSPKHTDWLGIEVLLELAAGGILALLIIRWLTT
jgi:hypothetical protein